MAGLFEAEGVREPVPDRDPEVAEVRTQRCKRHSEVWTPWI